MSILLIHAIWLGLGSCFRISDGRNRARCEFKMCSYRIWRTFLSSSLVPVVNLLLCGIAYSFYLNVHLWIITSLVSFYRYKQFTCCVFTFVQLLRIKVRLPVLLCAVKPVVGCFRFSWAISTNVGQTHKENPNLVRNFYDIYIKWYIQTVQQITQTLIHKNPFTSLCRRQNPASKMHETCIWNTSYVEHCMPFTRLSGVNPWKKITLNCSYRIFIIWKSRVFWARILLS